MDTRIKIADCNGLANAVTGVCIFVMGPVLLEQTGGPAIWGCLPWLVCSMPFLIAAVILLLINGDIVGGMANALLTGIALFNNVLHALRAMVCTAYGIELSAEAEAGIQMMDGMGYLACALFLIAIVFLCSKVNYVQAVFTACPCIGFFALFAAKNLGMNTGTIPGVMIFSFGCWQLYSGIAMMLHQATGHQLLPYIVAPKSGKTMEVYDEENCSD